MPSRTIEAGTPDDARQVPARPARGFTERFLPALFVAPILLAMLALFLWPLLESIVNSFHENTLAGIDRSQWTLENYGRMLDSYYLSILIRTFRISVMTMLITTVLAFPVAWYIASLKPRTQAYWLLLFVTPWLVNVAVKAFGWTLILGGNGMLNRALRHLDLIESPLRLMFTETGIVIGLVHGHFMFILLPLWAALAGFDRSLIWAAGNLGGRRHQIFTRIILPLTLPALVAGMIINFTMNMAAFATPALLGGSRVRVMSYLAYETNLVELNWPFGAAMAMVLLIVTLSVILISQRITASGRRRVLFS